MRILPPLAGFLVAPTDETAKKHAARQRFSKYSRIFANRLKAARGNSQCKIHNFSAAAGCCFRAEASGGERKARAYAGGGFGSAAPKEPDSRCKIYSGRSQRGEATELRASAAGATARTTSGRIIFRGRKSKISEIRAWSTTAYYRKTRPVGLRCLRRLSNDKVISPPGRIIFHS